MFGSHKQPFSIDIFFGIVETSAPTLSWGAFTIQEEGAALPIGWKERHYNIEKRNGQKLSERIELTFYIYYLDVLGKRLHS